MIFFIIKIPNIVVVFSSNNKKVTRFFDKIKKRDGTEPSVSKEDDLIVKLIGKEVDDIVNTFSNNRFLKSIS